MTTDKQQKKPVFFPYPVRILQDRYGGTYSGGEWVAVARADCYGFYTDVEDVIDGDDLTAAEFPEHRTTWARDGKFVGLGSTPDEAYADLLCQIENAGYTVAS